MDEFQEVFGYIQTVEVVAKKTCTHTNMVKDDNGLHVCADCGAEREIFDYEPEWRMYVDDQGAKDPVRCHNIISEQNCLDKVFERFKISLSEEIKTEIASKYNTISQTLKKSGGSSTCRGRGRLSIIAACLFVYYKNHNDTRPNDQVRDLFDLTRKSLTEGLSSYYEVFRKERIKITKAKDLVKSYVSSSKLIPKELVSEMTQFTSIMDGKTQTLNRSCPQAIAAACILYYASNVKQIPVHRATFARNVNLSEITITRLTKEIARIIPNFKISDGVTTLLPEHERKH